MIVGLRGFYDAGKILNDPNSDQLHTAYGGGIFLIPLTRSYTVSFLLGFSEEESGILSLNLGTNF